MITEKVLEPRGLRTMQGQASKSNFGLVENITSSAGLAWH